MAETFFNLDNAVWAAPRRLFFTLVDSASTQQGEDTVRIRGEQDSCKHGRDGPKGWPRFERACAGTFTYFPRRLVETSGDITLKLGESNGCFSSRLEGCRGVLQMLCFGYLTTSTVYHVASAASPEQSTFLERKSEERFSRDNRLKGDYNTIYWKYWWEEKEKMYNDFCEVLRS